LKKIGFVVPWYGDSIPGGAEMLVRGLTDNLNKRGIAIEILTTCVREFASDWNVDFYEKGETTSEKLGVKIIRFPVRKRNTAKFDEINGHLIQGKIISPEQEKVFLEEMVNSSELYKYMEEHYDEYSYFFYAPYMFGTTYYGCIKFPEKSIVIPCFHDEAYFHFSAFASCFSSVKGLIYNALPEYELANTYYDLASVKQLVLGTGVDISVTGDADQFKQKYGLEGPFMIYAGRKDKGKNVDTLLRFFEEYHARKASHNIPSDLKLVLIGGGEIEIPEAIGDKVVDLGFVPVQDKYDAMAAGTVLCQPSHNESFSLVIMESWLCMRPVLVNEDCPVTTNFVKESNGGLYFRNYYDFEGCLDYFLANEESCKAMASNGRDYVIKHFSWDAIIDNLMEFLNHLDDNKEDVTHE